MDLDTNVTASTAGLVNAAIQVGFVAVVEHYKSKKIFLDVVKCNHLLLVK